MAPPPPAPPPPPLNDSSAEEKILDRKLYYFREFLIICCCLNLRVFSNHRAIRSCGGHYHCIRLFTQRFGGVFVLDHVCVYKYARRQYTRAAVSDDSNLFARVFLDVLKFGLPPENNAN